MGLTAEKGTNPLVSFLWVRTLYNSLISYSGAGKTGEVGEGKP
jgi:hypothetical protein